MKQATQDPIVLTGYTHVIGALADIFQSRELNPARAKTGDMKLWCQRGKRVWTGQFRAAVFDGRKWRTFRLNIVAEGDARYDSFDNRTAKARRCFAALAQLKNQTARLRDGTYGCTFTMKADVSVAAPKADVSVAAPAAVVAPHGTTVGDTKSLASTSVASTSVASTSVASTPVASTPPVATLTAARTAQTPALGTSKKVQATGRKRKRKGSDPNQLTLF